MCEQHASLTAEVVLAEISRRRFLRLIGIGAATAGASTALSVAAPDAFAATPPVDPTSAWAWYKTDPHVHSCVSGDGECDVGIIAAKARALGYSAMFLTDHQAASSGVIGSVIANHMVLDDDLGTKWKAFKRGTTSTVTTAMVTSPVKAGTKSLKLACTSTATGEAGVCHQRGPSLNATGHTMTFSVNASRIDPGCGFAVTCAIGGDSRIEPPEGFTTTDNVAHPGRAIVLVWQTAPFFQASSNPDSRVIVATIPKPATGSWTNYNIDVAAALATIPAAERPLDYNAINQVTITAFADHGSVSLNVDAFHFDVSTAPSGAAEFMHRNSKISDFNTAVFKVFPSIEIGLNRHVQRFEFAITQASQMPTYTQGSSSVQDTQRLGTPAQLNHPGLPGGTNATETLDNLGYGADWIECCPRPGTPTVMMDLWDSILLKSHILGSWTSDMHKTVSLTAPDRNLATYVLSEGIGFNQLIRSFWEGRCYMATNVFPGRVRFTAGPLDTPYPARYPLWISSSSPSADIRLRVDAGLSTSHSVVWIIDDTVVATDKPAGSSYDATRRVTVNGNRSYVRATVKDGGGTYVAATQPILLLPVNGLASGSSVAMERLLTSDGRHYTRLDSPGITSVTGDLGSTIISLTNPAGSLADIAFTTSTPPTSVSVAGGAAVGKASRQDVQASTSSCWSYDSANRLLTIRVAHGSLTSLSVVVSRQTNDTTPPSAPTNLRASASGTSISLAWSGSTDDSGIRGYQLKRNGNFLAEVAGLSYTDSGLNAGTTYSYTVEAVDTSGNHSPLSGTATATTAAAAAQLIFPCVADGYVDTSTGAGYGTALKLRVDASPVVRSYLRFDLSGLPSTIKSARLRLRTTSTCSHLRASTTGSGWTETGLTAASAPAVGTSLDVATGLASGAWAELDVTAGITGNGSVSLVLTTDSTTAASLSSREGTDPPQLLIDT
ncbi:MAG TPA: DNRLRE domain-containing protein [Mycobacteriales bacterium]|nr:DNRLRE domain-containing protein [Mycobacteriales bacterium]